MFGYHVTPVIFYVNNQRVEASPARRMGARGTLDEKQMSDKRRLALAAGRMRLAAINSALNEGGFTLADLRLRAGLSQFELAKRLDKQQPNIARMEKHPGNVELDTMIALAKALECDINTVLEAILATNKRAQAHG